MENQKSLVTLSTLTKESYEKKLSLIEQSKSLSVKSKVTEIRVKSYELVDKVVNLTRKYNYSIRKIDIELEALKSYGLPLVIVVESYFDEELKCTVFREAISPEKGYKIEWYEAPETMEMVYKFSKVENVE